VYLESLRGVEFVRTFNITSMLAKVKPVRTIYRVIRVSRVQRVRSVKTRGMR
jgi:hypothetical protein